MNDEYGRIELPHCSSAGKGSGKYNFKLPGVIAECQYCNVCFGKADIDYWELAEHMIKEHEATIDGKTDAPVNMKALKRLQQKEEEKAKSDVAAGVADYLKQAQAQKAKVNV